MRTTINIHDDLLHQAKQAALDRGCTLGEVIDQALLELFSRRLKAGSRPATRIPTFGGRGLQPGIDLDSTSSLLDAMEER